MFETIGARTPRTLEAATRKKIKAKKPEGRTGCGTFMCEEPPLSGKNYCATCQKEIDRRDAEFFASQQDY